MRQTQSATLCEATASNESPAERTKAETTALLFARLHHLALRYPQAEFDESTCRRYLSARKGDADAAARDIQKCMQWREEARPGDITPDDIKAELATGKAYCHGYDKSGRSIVWNFAGRHDKRTRDAEATVSLILYSLETAIKAGKKHGVDQICAVFDLSGFGTKNMDYEVTHRLIQLLTNYYPGRLGKILFLNAPMIFNAFWSCIRSCIDPATYEKIQFANKSVLCSSIDPAMFPQEVADMLQRLA